nr:uncharacterized protein LOC100675969 [Loxodonta africana]
MVAPTPQPAILPETLRERYVPWSRHPSLHLRGSPPDPSPSWELLFRSSLRGRTLSLAPQNQLTLGSAQPAPRDALRALRQPDLPLLQTPYLDSGHSSGLRNSGDCGLWGRSWNFPGQLSGSRRQVPWPMASESAVTRRNSVSRQLAGGKLVNLSCQRQTAILANDCLHQWKCVGQWKTGPPGNFLDDQIPMERGASDNNEVKIQCPELSVAQMPLSQDQDPKTASTPLGLCHLTQQILHKSKREQVLVLLNTLYKPLLFSSSGMLQSKVQKRTAYSQRQKSILQVWFEYNPHPNKATREQLAEDIGVPEHKIQVGIKFLFLSESRTTDLRFERPSSLVPSFVLCSPSEYLPKEARSNQTSIMRCQTSTLLQAFQENQFPGLAATEKLAKQTEVPKSRIQVSSMSVAPNISYLMSFQNQEAQHLGHSKREPVNSSEDGPNRWPHLTAQPEQMDLSTLPGMSPFPPSDFFGRNQTFLPTLPESHVSFVGCDSDGFCVSQASTVLTVQPAQAVQGVENSDSLVTGTEHLPVQLTLGGALSNTQPLFWPQSQEKCQDPKQHIGTEALQLKDFSQIDPEHEKQELQPLGQHDISYIMQWWEEWCQAVIAEWEPSREMLRHPGYTETHLEQQQAQSAEELSHPTDQLHQQ